MGHRIALKPNTPLRLCNSKGEAIQCVIEKEIGRGGSCIVYEASRETETGDKTLYRVKEFYPYKLSIAREEDDRLVPASNDKDTYIQRQEQFLTDFSRTSRLFYSGANYSSMTNQLDVFNQNGTSYVLSTYSSKKTLAAYKPETLKECITLVKQTAYVLGNIHKQGYLYLDIKPDNVLVVDGMQKQIQLFDFDSLLLLSDIKKKSGLSCSDIRLSFSKGFAPIELQTSKIKRLGPHADVFGVGALLFYLLFETTPKAPDCEMDAVYDFPNFRYGNDKYDDKLFSSLTDFFHNALAVYYADRYQSMDEAYEQLQEIEKYADTTIPRIFSTKIIKPKILFGRDAEFEELNRLLSDADYNCIFITGMGGIGKSAFVREYLFRNRKKFDTVLYMHFKGNIENTISDDDNIEINTLRQDEEVKSNERYFNKKVRKIRALTRGTSTVIVIDNFIGDVDADLRDLLTTGCKVILITRQVPAYRNCHKLKIEAISDPYALQQLFETNLGHLLGKDEYDSFEKIVKRADGHTLVLELIAKQIANSRNSITLSSASALVEEHGFSIAPERVDYEKDNKTDNDTIGNIIDALFEANELTDDKKILMKVASLLGDDGMNINQFHDVLEIECKNDANELIKDGWLMIAGDIISMHRVIQDSVHRWEWTSAYVAAAERFLSYFYVEIRLESTKNNYPKKLRKCMTAANAELPPELKEKRIFQKLIAHRDRSMKTIDQWRENQFNKQGLIGKVNRERFARAEDETPADLAKLASLLMQSEDILRQCKREPAIKASDVYVNLLYITVLNTPQYREEYILAETNNIFSNGETDFVLKGTAELLDESESRNPVTIMQLYAMAVRIHADNERFEEAEKLLSQAKKVADKVRHHKVYALYYDLLSDYYDTRLNGAYDTEGPDEELLLSKMLEAIEKALRYSKRGLSHDGNHLYVKNLLAKATILMRSGKGSDKEVSELIESAKKIIDENTSTFADVRLQYYLVHAWYYVYIRPNPQMANLCIQMAQVLSRAISSTDLQKIFNVTIPCSNVFFELQCYDEAISLLQDGIKLCAKHANTDSYARMKQELCEHLWEVGIKAQQFELCRKIIELIEAENKEIVDPKNKVVISDDVRLTISINLTT